MSNLDFVLADIKAKAPKDYNVILLAPAKYQRALIAFYGFDLLLQQAVQQVREPAMLGIRLQYFIDQMSLIYKEKVCDAVPALQLITDLIKEKSIEIEYWHDYVQAILQSQNRDKAPKDWHESLALLRACRDPKIKLLQTCLGARNAFSEDVFSYYAYADYIDWMDFDLRHNQSRLPQSVREDCQMSGNLYALNKADIKAFSNLYVQKLDDLWGQIVSQMSKMEPAVKMLILQAHYRHQKLSKRQNLAPIAPDTMAEMLCLLWWRFKY